MSTERYISSARRRQDAMPVRTDGSAVECPECGAQFGGMSVCPWDGSKLVPLPNADPTAVAFYEAIS